MVICLQCKSHSGSQRIGTCRRDGGGVCRCGNCGWVHCTVPPQLRPRGGDYVYRSRGEHTVAKVRGAILILARFRPPCCENAASSTSTRRQPVVSISCQLTLLMCSELPPQTPQVLFLPKRRAERCVARIS